MILSEELQLELPSNEVIDNAISILHPDDQILYHQFLEWIHSSDNQSM
jgi:hypothetical protein